MLPGNGQCLNGTGKPQVPNLVNAIPTDDKRGSWEPLRSHSPESLYNVSPVCSHTHAGVSYICDRKPSLRRRTIQYSALLVAVPLALMTWATLWQGGFPQSYTDILKLEIDLPQHQWEDTQLTAEGKLVQVQHNGELKFVDWGRDAGEGYIRFPDHLWGQGFNSIFQEGILYAQLAHLANRSYIFEDYVWSQTTLPYTLRNAALRLSRTPLNALISRFMAGGDVSTSPYSKKPSHNSISARYYEYICPSTLSERYRVTLSANDAPHFADGLSQMAWWVNRVKEVGKGKRCVDIQESGIRGTVGAQGKRVFDNQFFGSKNRIGQLVPQLIKSPVLQRFSWSPLVVDVVERTTHALGTKSPETSIDSTGTRNTIQGLLAIDLTWGDCAKPSQLNRGFTGFNNADAMMDKFFDEEAVESSSPEGRAEVDGYHLKRCNPSTDQLVQRAREVSVDWSRASEHTPLTKVVLISDDLSAQHLELSSALEKEGFEILDADQRVRKGLGRIEDVAVAVDMALAARAEDFLGNGFSPLSGNVALLRMARGYEGEANRLV
ncbi:hypothetical protein DFP72DRAFT_1008234 [Ephemerocybe angulata]|uniref:Uncharacterized protein n=1 Tax=Ephemerocybe angulata TaxID=980116 RepID=A0A8H6I2G9_9AGAR|nr:hypothetical protein DFP72DRAFT_1008234 [Tulosesus angulatus]